jgi:hypothetical protein
MGIDGCHIERNSRQRNYTNKAILNVLQHCHCHFDRTTGQSLDSIIPPKEMSRLDYSAERNVCSLCNIIYSSKSELLVSILGRISAANDKMKIKLSQLCLNIKSMPKAARVVATARKPLQSMSGSSSTALAKLGYLNLHSIALSPGFSQIRREIPSKHSILFNAVCR